MLNLQFNEINDEIAEYLANALQKNAVRLII